MKARVLACRLALTFIIVVGLLFPSSVPNVKAYSTEITYTTDDYKNGGLSQNNGTYAMFTVGSINYYAFIVGSHIGVYTSSASLSRDIDISAYRFGYSKIYALNATHALVVGGNGHESDAGSSPEHAVVQSLLVKIATGAVTSVGTADMCVNGATVLGISPIFKYSTDYYVLVNSVEYYGAYNTQFVVKIYPTVATTALTNDAEHIRGPMFIIPDQNDATAFYVIGRESPYGLRFRLLKIDFTGVSVDYLGDGAVNYDWSNYTVCMGSRLNDMGSYDLLVSYPDLASSYKIDTTLIRFNDTYLSEWSVSMTDNSAEASFLRPTRFGTAGQNAYGNLTNGLYPVYYIGESYNVWSLISEIADIDTDTPIITQFGSGPYMEYPTRNGPYASAQIGGLAPPEFLVGIWIDYTNHKFKASTYPQLWYGTTDYAYTITIYDTVTHTYKTGYGDIESNRPYRIDITWTYQGSYTVQGSCYLQMNGTTIGGSNKAIVNSRVSYLLTFSSYYVDKMWGLRVYLFDSANGHMANYLLLLYINPPSTTTTSHTSTNTGIPPDVKDYLPNFAWMIALLVCLTPGIFLGAKYGLFAGILGVAFGLGLTYVFPVINLPLALQAFVIVGMAFALFFGGHGWSGPKK